MKIGTRVQSTINKDKGTVVGSAVVEYYGEIIQLVAFKLDETIWRDNVNREGGHYPIVLVHEENLIPEKSVEVEM